MICPISLDSFLHDIPLTSVGCTIIRSERIVPQKHLHINLSLLNGLQLNRRRVSFNIKPCITGPTTKADTLQSEP